MHYKTPSHISTIFLLSNLGSYHWFPFLKEKKISNYYNNYWFFFKKNPQLSSGLSGKYAGKVVAMAGWQRKVCRRLPVGEIYCPCTCLCIYSGDEAIWRIFVMQKQARKGLPPTFERIYMCVSYMIWNMYFPLIFISLFRSWLWSRQLTIKITSWYKTSHWTLTV